MNQYVNVEGGAPMECGQCGEPSATFHIGDFEDVDTNCAAREMACTKCGWRWREIYLFSHTEDVEE